MSLDRKTQPAEAERLELERVSQALARWPRLSQLLRYMGEKLVSGDVDQINEYNIATEVLGRSKTVFNAAEDAIARVETHRLRKRLAEFYELEGRDHPVQITLPAGSYVPVFVHKAQPSAVASNAAPPAADVPPPAESDPQPKGWDLLPSTGAWKYGALVALLAIAGVVAYLYLHGRTLGKRVELDINSSPAGAFAPAQSQAASIPLRILAGYTGPPRTDSAGRIWSPDEYFVGGATWQRSPGPIARTGDPFIFEHWRNGDFTYQVPLKPGSYELHLFFSTPSESVATFNVMLNGQFILEGFDVNSDALGADIADERVFRNVSPGQDGFLRLQFAGAITPPSLNAIEILASERQAQLPIRLITQPTPLTDSKGQFWRSDDYYMNGHLGDQAKPLLDSRDPDLFAKERYGHFTYAIPVDVRDTYTLVLHFAELYFSSPASGMNGRMFKVMCNGQTLLDNFDVFREGGSLHEVTKTFRHLKPSAQGKLNIIFEPIINNATVSGIEVLDEAQ